MNAYAVLIRRQRNGKPITVVGTDRFPVEAEFVITPGCDARLEIDRDLDWVAVPLPVHGWALTDDRGRLLWWTEEYVAPGQTMWVRR